MESLRHIREQAGYSQQDLADESGVSQHTISELELGRRSPQGRTLRKLAQVLGVEVADLREDTASPKAKAPPSQRSPSNGGEEERRESETPETAIHDLYGWVEDMTTEELKQMALEQTPYVKTRTREEWLEEYKTDNKAWRDKEVRRVLAWANIRAIHAELEKRGARSDAEHAVKQYNEVMGFSEETPQQSHEVHEGQEGQRAG